MPNKTTVEIPIQWLERLIILGESLSAHSAGISDIAYIKGYIESAEGFIGDSDER